MALHRCLHQEAFFQDFGFILTPTLALESGVRHSGHDEVPSWDALCVSQYLIHLCQKLRHFLLLTTYPGLVLGVLC